MKFYFVDAAFHFKIEIQRIDANIGQRLNKLYSPDGTTYNMLKLKQHRSHYKHNRELKSKQKNCLQLQDHPK